MSENTKGAGGGKSSGGGGGQIAPESFTTNELVLALHLLGEGEVNLYTDGEDYLYPGQSIFVNNVPLQNIDATFNLGNTVYEYRSGTPNQSPMTTPIFPSASDVVIVGTEVYGGGGDSGPAAPVTYTTSSALVDYAYVNIEFPNGLFVTDGNGNVNGWQVHFTIDTKAAADGAWTNIYDIVYGAMLTQPDVASYIVTRPADATGTTWDIRVSRLTADNDGLTQKSDIVVASIEECVAITLPYDGVAYCGMSIDASNLGGMSNAVPTFAFLVQNGGIQIPTNYDPATNTFVGLWDGTFTIGVTDDPAWILYDALTNANYGAALYGIDVTNIDLYSFYNASVFNNALVPDGNGGYEPRFTFNAPIQNRIDMLECLQNVAGAMNAVIGEQNGLITVFQDRPTDSMYPINKSNVICQEGSVYFNYVGSALTSRTTVVNATWSNASDVRYLPTVTSVIDPVGLARYGYIAYDLAAYGATTEGQAMRAGKWWIYTNEYQTDTVQFKMGLQGLTCNLYDVFDLYDEDYTTQTGAGTILSATSDTVVLDKPCVIDGGSPTISILLQDGVTYETHPITSGAGTYADITISGTWSVTPTRYCPYIITSAIAARTFRIIDMKLDGATKTVDIIAQLYFKTNYETIEAGLAIPAGVYTQPVLNTVPNPTSLTFVPSQYINPINQQLQYNLIVSWLAPSGTNVSGYIIAWNYNNGPYTYTAKQLTTSFTLNNILDGTYNVTVFAQNIANTSSTGLTGSYAMSTTGGSPTATSLLDVTNLTIVGGGDTFTTQDCVFTFTNPDANQGILKGTRLEIINVSTSTVVRSVALTPVTGGVTQTYTYTFGQNTSDFGGTPHRSFKVFIQNIDAYNNYTTGVSATFTNPFPAEVTGLTATASVLGNVISWAANSEPDIKGYLVWRGTTNSYTLSGSNLVAVTSATTFTDGGLTAGTEYYYVVAAYDPYGYSTSGTGMNVSAYTGAVPITFGISSGSSNPAGDTASGFFYNTTVGILYQWNGSSWVSVGIATGASLPASGYSGQMFADTSNGYLYTWNGSSWVVSTPPASSVDAGAIIGQLVGSQLANQTVTATNIANGTIGTTQITDGAITTPLIGANAVTADNIAANTITSSQIAANTITASQIAANTITASQIAANTITAAQIEAATITATQIAASTITAGLLNVAELSAISANLGTVTAGTIQGTLIETSTGTGSRIVINNSGNNQLWVYNSSDEVVVEIGGTSGGLIYADNAGAAQNAIYASSETNDAAIVGVNAYGGTGVWGSASSSIGVNGSSTSSIGVQGNSNTGVAVFGNSTNYVAGYFTSTGSNYALNAYGSGGYCLIMQGLLLQYTGSAAMNAIYPNAANTYDLGTAALPWAGGYIQSAWTVTSDRRTKTEIADTNLGLDFIMALKPRSYKMTVGQQAPVYTDKPADPARRPADLTTDLTYTQRAGARTHHGFVADEVKAALDKVGVTDAALWCLADPSDPTSAQALRYEELIASLVAAVQNQQFQIETLREQTVSLLGLNTALTQIVERELKRS